MRLAKLGVLALSSLLCLTACQAGVSAEQTKSALLQKEYKVSVITAEEFSKTLTAQLFPNRNGLQNYLTALRGSDDFLFAFYFSTIEEASTFTDQYIVTLSRIEHESTKQTKTGSKNNAVYFGTETAVNDSGLGSF